MITREEVKLIYETVDVDWINDHDYDTYDIITKLCTDMLYMMDKLECQLELLSGYNQIMKELNKENKKLYKELNSKKK